MNHRFTQKNTDYTEKADAQAKAGFPIEAFGNDKGGAFENDKGGEGICICILFLLLNQKSQITNLKAQIAVITLLLDSL